VGERFAEAQFPFLGDRLIPRIAVQGTAGENTLETGLRNPKPWGETEKRELIARGYALLDDALAHRADVTEGVQIGAFLVDQPLVHGTETALSAGARERSLSRAKRRPARKPRVPPR